MPYLHRKNEPIRHYRSIQCVNLSEEYLRQVQSWTDGVCLISDVAYN